MARLRENTWWILWSLLLVAQIGASFIFFNQEGSRIVGATGWLVMLGGLALGSLGVSTLKRFGGVPDAEQSRRRFGVGTTKIVRKGVYSIVRHPQYLSWVFVSLALMLIAQDSSVVLFGIGSALALYMQARQDDESLLQKFGKEYADYMQVVPRMNPIVGILRRFRGAP